MRLVAARDDAKNKLDSTASHIEQFPAMDVRSDVTAFLEQARGYGSAADIDQAGFEQLARFINGRSAQAGKQPVTAEDAREAVAAHLTQQASRQQTAGRAAVHFSGRDGAVDDAKVHDAAGRAFGLADPMAGARLQEWRVANPHLPVRERAPAIGPANATKAWALAFRATQQGVHLLNFEASQLREMVATVGGEYAATNALGVKAVADWRASLLSSGLKVTSYALQELLGGVRSSEEQAELTEKHNATLRPFEDKPSSTRGQQCLVTLRGELTAQISKMDHILNEKGAAATGYRKNYDYEDLQDSVLTGIASLLALTMQTGNLEAARVVDELMYGLDRHRFLQRVGFDVIRLQDPTNDSAAPEAARTLSILDRHPEWRTDALALIEAHSTPAGRAQMLPVLSRASTSYQGDHYAIVIDEAFRWADAIHQIDHPGQAYAPEFGSHPLIGKLFQFGGQELTATMEDGNTVSGRLLQVNDVNANQEGSVAIMELIQAKGDVLENSLKYEIDLSKVDKIEIGGKVIHDRATDGVVSPRVFADVSDQERFVADQFAALVHYIVGDYTIQRDHVERLLSSIVVGPETSGREDLVKLWDERASGAVFVKDAMDAILLSRKALEVIGKDVGDERQYAAALTAVGVAQGTGYKGWGIDMSTLSQRTGGDFAKEVGARRDENHDTLSLLQKGSPETKAAVVEEVLAQVPGRMLQYLQSRCYAVDERVRPFIEWVCGGPQPELQYLAKASLEAVGPFANLLARLQQPDPFKRRDDRLSFGSEPLGFMAHEIPSLVRQLGAQDRAGLLGELRRIATTAPRSFGANRESEQAIRRLAGDAADKLEALDAVPWGALDDIAFPKKSDR